MDQGCECGHPACWNGLDVAQEDAAAGLVHVMAAFSLSDIAAASAKLGSVDAALVLLAAEDDWDEEEPLALGADWIAERLGWLSAKDFHRAVDILVEAGALSFDGAVVSFEPDDTAGSVDQFLRGHGHWPENKSI